MSGGRAPNMIDVTGQQFKYLTAIERDEKPGYWRCKCACGNDVVVAIYALISVKTWSCGCISKKRDGRTNHPAYSVWSGLMRRVRLKEFAHPDIDVDPRWSDFWVFAEEVGDRPSFDHVLFRIDTSKGFYKDNVEWITRTERGKKRGRFGWESKRKSSLTQ